MLMDIEKKGLLEVRFCEKEGYHPQIWQKGWRVAYLNDTPVFHMENISDMQRHNMSDEVFILLEGSCTLYIGDGEGMFPGEITAVPLKRGVMYNVKKGVWHTHILGEKARVVVIEDADVSSENSDHIPVKLV